ncbi:MAG: immunoglobulin domain-containing protein, partial [Saprospiraceae bacterium]
MLSGLIMTMALLAFICFDIKAANITVNTALDEVNGNTSSIANLIATPGGAGISLREAIIASNNTAGADVIFFNAALNGVPIILTRVGNDADATNGDLDINDNLTITGNGSSNTFIQGAADAAFTGSIGDKVIGINQDGTHMGLTVSITGVTIRYGKNTIPFNDPTFAYTGAGVDIFLTGVGNNISFSDCVISNNKHTTAYGGGVNIDSGISGLPGDIPVNTASRGTVTFTNCTISNNEALMWGGGMNLFSDIHNVTLTNCTIQNNTTLGTGGLGGNGGGINIRHTYGGTVTMTGGSVSNNTGIAYGGGLCILLMQATNISGTTISGNTVKNNPGFSDFAIGGGIYQSSSLTTTLTNVTVSGNHADLGTGAGGGGIFADTGPINISGGSITGNTAREGGGVCIEDANINLTNLTIGTNTAAVNGGGLLIRSTATGTTTLDGVTLNSNIADSDNNGSGDGGGIFRAAGTLNLNNTITVGSTGMGNTAVNGGGIANTGGNLSKTTGLLTVAANNAKNNGGGYYFTSGTINFQKTVIINNTANSDNSGGGEGGGIYNNGGTLTLNFNRIVLNIANANTASNAMRHVSGTITNIQNNWWGTNSPATVINGTASFTPYLQLLHTPTSNSICQNTSTGLTASFVLNSASTNVLANIDRLIGLPITFNNATPSGSNISGAQATIQANGQATATFNAGSTGGVGGADAIVDGFTSHATITVQTIPVVTLDPLSQSICPGAPVTFTSAATGNPVPTVQWQISINNGMSFSDIGGAISTSLMFNVATADNLKQYHAVFNNVCGNDISANAILTVYPVENPNFAYNNPAYCHVGMEDPLPVIYGTTGGVFTAPAPLSINA